MSEIAKGFEAVSSRPLPTMRGEAVQLRHTASGARILHIRCPEAENCFCIAVPTPPPDDTGMPHILEHMTLAGSEKFPCKEPFFEMIKRSVATFINALTGNDITYYPVCSTVKADLFNLADVYFDAVFHPLLSDKTFAREAYHLAPADPAAPTGNLRYDGIVYSEMKGVFSSPEGILERDSIRRLLPDTCHGRESGGNPENIPDLTLAALRAFHSSRYNPSNAFIILFGDIPTNDWLEFLTPRLAGFKPQPPLPPIARQPRWDAPRSFSSRYPLPAGEDTASKTYLMLNWLVGDATDLAFSARLAILSYLLCGNDASPLSKAIDDSHIGANLIISGGIPNGLEQTWHLALDGSEPDRMPAFRKVVLDTLEKLAANPFPQEDVEAAFQQTVYACNEIDAQYAFSNAMNAATAWCAGLDPASLLEKAPHFEQARREIEADPMLLPRMVRELFLDNPHRLDIVMAPSHEVEAEQEAALAKRLADARAKMSDEDATAIANAAAELEAANARPNTPDDLACLPNLRTSDMPPDPPTVPYDILPLPCGCELLAARDVTTNGIDYLTLSFDIRGLPEHLIPFIQSYAGAVEDFGTKGLDYVAAAKKRARCTGAFSAKYSARVKYGPDGEFLPAIDIGVKTTSSSLDAALEALREAIFDLDPRDPARMADILTQTLAFLRSDFVQDARATTRRHAARMLSAAAARDYAVSGLPSLRLAERLAAMPAAEAYEECASRIEEIRDWLIATRRVTASLVAPAADTPRVAAALTSWLSATGPAGVSSRPVGADLQSASTMAAVPADALSLAPRNEGLSAALQVSFSALYTPAPRTHAPEAAPLMAGASIVSSDYMLPEIRFKGNAYGAGLAYDASLGTLCFSSYRDPHIAETYATMLGAAVFARSRAWTKETVDNAILTVVRGFVAPQRPAAACSTILSRHLSCFDDATRGALYRRILALRASEVQDTTVAAIEDGLRHAAYCVAASESALSAADIPGLTIEPIIS